MNRSGTLLWMSLFLYCRSLQRTLNDLKDYQEKHETWQSIQEKVQMDQASSDSKFAQRVGYESYKIRKMAADGGQCS